MDRREALKNVALLMGGAISVTTMGVLFDSCNRTATNGNLFNTDQQTLVTEIADIIIPTTDTPGAKAAGVGPFITMMVNECYPEKAQKVFVDGLKDVEDRSKSKFGNNFMGLSADQRNTVLKEIADETVKLKAADKKKADAEKANNPPTATSKGKTVPKGKPYFFQIMRELTLLGYFTSEIGATKALAYVAVPGRYDGCVDLQKGQKTWAL